MTLSHAHRHVCGLRRKVYLCVSILNKFRCSGSDMMSANNTQCVAKSANRVGELMTCPACATPDLASPSHHSLFLAASQLQLAQLLLDRADTDNQQHLR